jgi:glutaredoxin 2
VRLRRGALALLCLSLIANTAVPQSLFDLDDWMQRIDDQSQDLQRHIGARNVPAAKDSAREIAELYDLMEMFFEKRGEAADAVRWSREGADWARQAQRDLDAKRFTAAKRNALSIAHGCRDCHYQYKPL